MSSNSQHAQPFICKENDTGSLFSYLHAHKAQRAYQEIRHGGTLDVLHKWPLLAEMHAPQNSPD